MESTYDVRIERGGSVPALVLQGEIDVAATADVSVIGAELLAEHPAQLVLDLSETAFLDSAGVGAIVNLRNAAVAAGGTTLLLRPGPRNVMRVLEMVGLADVFQLVS